MKTRIILFTVTNLLILTAISIFTYFTGLEKNLSLHGISVSEILIFCFIWGMGGSILNLLISKLLAKITMGVSIVNEHPDYSKLVEKVKDLSNKAGLKATPDVGVYNSPELNAFATGPSQHHSLIAVSTGLLRNMNDQELEGVLAHEIAHIKNGDMVTMTLLQGVMNTFVLFFSRVIAHLLINQVRQDNRLFQWISTFLYFGIVLTLQVIFGMFASLLLNWFSRSREYRADSGAIDLSSKESILAALNKLASNYEHLNPQSNKSFNHMQISSKQFFFDLFSTHPKLQDRINAIKTQ